MKVAQLRGKTRDELIKERGKIERELFRLRVQRTVGQLAQNHLFSVLRKDIARINTVLNEEK